MQLNVLDHPAATRAGVSGLLLTEHGTGTGTGTGTGKVSMSIDYSGFRDVYGGDWAQRLRLVQLPACAVTTPTVPACQKQTALPSTNDTEGAASQRPGARRLR